MLVPSTPPADSPMELLLLGCIELRDAPAGDSLLRKPRATALVAYLAVGTRDENAYVRRDTLVGLFWPDSDQEHARAALRKLLHDTRADLHEGAIETRGDEDVRLAPHALRCDARELEKCAARGAHAAAVELYKGDFMPGFFLPGGAGGFERWLEVKRAQIREHAADSAWALVTSYAAENTQLTDAVRWVRKFVRIAPYDERRFRKIATVLAEKGECRTVLLLYGEMKRGLREMGLDPSSEMERFMAEMTKKFC